VTARPGFRHAWADYTYFHQVAITPLAAADTESMIQALLQPYGAAAVLQTWLYGRMGGNPFFVEELVRALKTHGLLTLQEGVYAMVARPMMLPASVQGIVQTRLDQLPTDEKSLLQMAAVIGLEVPVPLLDALAAWPGTALHRGLAHLQAGELQYETSLFPAHAYTFTHALMHEVAYQSLLLEQRRMLHGRIAEAIEALAADRVDEQVECLAYHAVRGEVWGKAVPWCQQAGTRAHDRAAFHEAVAFFDQALQALAYLPDDSDTRVRAIEIRLAVDLPLRSLGENGRRLALLGEAEAMATACDDRARLGRVLAQLGQVRRITGDRDGAIAAGQQDLALLGEAEAMATACDDRARRPSPWRLHSAITPYRCTQPIT
jgi:predicted ATPase